MTIPSDVTEVGKQIVAGLPAQFLALLCINTVFVLGLLWFLDHRSSGEERILTPLLTACMQEIPVAALQHLK